VRNHDYWVYILTNKRSTTLYIGITNNIARRLSQHRACEVEGFTKHYRLNRLVWVEHFRNVNDAIACEKKLKGWRRSRKIAIIEQTNPSWLDLSADWGTAAEVLRSPLGDGRNDQRFFASLRMTLNACCLSC
jgi:putative endonuclease